MALAPISAKASLDATEFTAGVLEIKKRLNELNAAYESNKAEMKQLGTEMNKLEREKRKLTEQMKDGGTDEQKQQLEALKDRIAQVATQLGSMRTKEAELKSELKVATQALDEEKKAAASASEDLEKHGDKTDELKKDTQSLETALNTVSKVLKDEESAAETSSQGLTALRGNVVKLNNELIEHRSKTKTVSEGLQELQKREKELMNSMKDGGTEEQKKQLEALKKQITLASSAIGILNLNEEELKAALKSATKALEEEKKAASSAADSLDRQDDETVELKKDTKELSNASDTAKTSVLNLGTAIKALIASAAAKTLWTTLIGSNAEMEQTLTSFTVMLDDAEKAKGLVKEMTEFAASTPLELPDVTTASQMLMNYGVAADEVIEKITRLGDLSGGNAAKLDRVSLAYGQMLAKGKVTGEEMRQMTEAGVPLLQALADTLGKTTAEVQDMVSKSKVGIDDLDRAIESLTTGSGQFSGMMEKQSQTMTGMLSTARDLISKFGRDVGEEAFAEAKDALSDLLETIRELEEDGTLAEWAKTVGGGIADVLRWAKEAVSAILSAGEPIAELTKFVIENKEAVLAGIAAYKGFATVQTIIKGVTAATKEYAAAQGITLAGASKTTLATTAASAGISKLGAVLSSTSVQMGALGIAIAAVVAEFNWLKQGFTVSEDVQKLADSVNDLKGSVEEAESSFAAEAAVLKTKAQAYDELRTKTDRTATEEERLSELAAELQETLGGNCTVVNALTGEYNDLTQAIDDYIKKQSASVRMSALEEQAKEAYKTLDEIEKKMEERTKAHEQFIEDEKERLSFWTDRGIDVNSVSFALPVETSGFLKDMEALREAESEAKQIVADYEAAFGNYMQGISEDSEAAAAAVAGNSRSAALSLEEIEKAAQDCRKATGELAKETKSLSSAFAEQNEDGSLSVDTILSLVDAGYAAALAVDAETGAVRLDTEAYKELAKAKIEAQKADLLEQRAQATQENIEKMNLASGSGDHKRIAELQKENEAIVVEYDVQIAALDSIDLDKVASGTYGEKKQSGSSGSRGSSGSKSAVKDVSGIQSEMKTLSDAFAEQKASGEIGIETANKLISLGYAQAVVTDQVTGKITLQSEEIKNLYDEKVEAAKKSESATQAEIDLLDLLSGKYGEVEEGVYGVKKAVTEESAKTVSELDSSMKALSEAFAEQNENGTLSLSTIQKMIDLGYEEALEIDETTGKITLKKEAVESLLGAQTDETAAALEAERAEQEAAGKTVKGTNAKISVLKQLQKQLNEVTDGTYGVQTDYSDINKAFKEAADERIKAIDAELSAKKKASEEAIAAIDAEIKARKRAKEDDDVQSEIDAVNAQLQYAQLDDFSRLQLERKLQGLQEQQADTAWERGAEDRKAAINAQYDLDEEKAAEEKERIKSGSEAVDRALKKAADGIELSAEEISAAVLAIQDVLHGITEGAIAQQASTQLYQSTTDGRTFNTNVNFASQGLTADQIVRMIVDALMSEPIL